MDVSHLINHSLELRIAFAIASGAIVFAVAATYDFVSKKLTAYQQRNEENVSGTGSFTVATAAR